MSALGQQRTRRGQFTMSAVPPKADIRPRDQDVCFGPILKGAFHASLKIVGKLAAVLEVEPAELLKQTGKRKTRGVR